MRKNSNRHDRAQLAVAFVQCSLMMAKAQQDLLELEDYDHEGQDRLSIELDNHVDAFYALLNCSVLETVGLYADGTYPEDEPDEDTK